LGVTSKELSRPSRHLLHCNECCTFLAFHQDKKSNNSDQKSFTREFLLCKFLALTL
jgi:hypothetical protein